MSLVPLAELPDSARLWCFGADRRPGPEETARLLDATRRFVESWTAHQEELRAAIDWRAHRFLLVAVDERSTRASGCSIDELMRHLQRLEDELDLTLADSSRVWFRDEDREGTVRCVGRDEFRELARRGRVGPGTPVFDLSAHRLGEARGGGWEQPASTSWHARLLPGPGAEASGPAS